MQAFYEKHPEYKDTTLSSPAFESYAAHYVPAVAAKLCAMNKAKSGPHLNLQVPAL